MPPTDKRTTHTPFDDPDNTLTSTAPYNFIPWPQEFRHADAEPGRHNLYQLERYSGWIELQIQTLTELFIRGTLTQSDYASTAPTEHPNASEHFFKPAQLGRIPGSTLRGLTRNLVEILSESRVEDVRDTLMFYRTMDGSSLASYYTGKMVQTNKLKSPQYSNDSKPRYSSYASCVSAGYVVRTDSGFKLYPSVTSNNVPFYRIDEANIPASIRAAWGGVSPVEWKREEIWFKPTQITDYSHRSSILRYAKLNATDCSATEPVPNTDWLKGWLIASGNVRSKHMHWIIGPRSERPLALNEDNLRRVIREYEREGLTKDVKDKGFSVLPQRIGDAIPCFYKMNGAELLAIGHTGMMRLPYQHTPASLLRTTVPGIDDRPGIAERMFGVSGAEEETHAGFVYFDDAILTDQAKMATTPELIKVLGEPHPTAFPHYVCQDLVRYKQKDGNKSKSQNDCTKVKETVVDTSLLWHWDKIAHQQFATPRGSKLVWHRRGINWREAPGESTPSHSAPISPVTTGALFCGRVRFDNLTKVQLGALLSALQLPTQQHAHKLGMGKPYGLGSVRISCRLFLVDRVQRYQFLFDPSYEGTTDGALNIGEREATSEITDFQKSFMKWVVGKEVSLDQFWKLPRMHELEVMLRFESSPPANQTEYLLGPGNNLCRRGMFYLRRILPGPLEVAGETPILLPVPVPMPVDPTPDDGIAASNVTELPKNSDSIETKLKQSTYQRGEKVKVKILERTGNVGPVELPNGEIVPNQNTSAYQVNQTVSMWIEQIDQGVVVKLSRNRVMP